MMTLSSSTAACEGRFSFMNLQKTIIHTSLSNQLLNDIISIAIDDVPFNKFKVAGHVNSWIVSSKRKRHLEGHNGRSSKKTKVS